ncbi:hypothetical protein ACO0LB_06430 [Undibacterium sp. SXout7W]|uniref:hypothetical protein n=1 Tax=Undibacterium sp. SXout7W TaxID=3413049 RepID=UPI003BEF98E8
MSDEKKDRYFSMAEAVDELRYGSFGKREKAVAGLKLLGKGLFNAAKFTVTEVLPEAAKHAEKQTEKMKAERSGKK